ncbi:glycoside hydrolase family 32 protein [Bacillus megaterium]|nr:glycoside hydrolase family 32 protein [Priestia megaterium]
MSVGDNDKTNGSTAQYFIGEFDGKEFKNDNGPETVLTTDVGQDFYAGRQTF